jgi:predicted aspartyl protease
VPAEVFNPGRGPLYRRGPLVAADVYLDETLVQARLEAGRDVPEPLRVTALIDTGAALTGIAGHVIRHLGLKQHGTEIVKPAAGDSAVRPTYPVRAMIPEVATAEVTAVEIADDPDFDMIIGRDLLAGCTLVYNGPAGWFALGRG